MVPGTVVPERSLQNLRSATDQQWEDAIADLTLHRLLPLVFYALNAQGLHPYIPKAILERLMKSYFSSKQRNVLFLKTLAVVLEQGYAAGVYPVLWKGVVLADQLYPDVATRMVGDIDWAISPQDLKIISPVLEKLGFALQPQMETPDAIYFKNSDGVFLDVHHRVRLFEDKEHLLLTQNLSSASGMLSSIRVLEPNAMLTHLTVHLSGHSLEMGLPLFWILDFVFLLRKWGNQIDLQRLKLLMPDRKSLRLLGRILRFLQVEFSEPLPPELAEFARHYKPLTLEGILCECRLALLGLNQPKGWLKLMACKVGLQSQQPPDYPQASILWSWATAAVLAGDR
jgi:hypothetical protein